MGLAGDFDGNEGSLNIFAKVDSGAEWTDGAKEAITTISADTTQNYINLNTSTVNNRMDMLAEANNVTQSRTILGLTTTDWMRWTLTWSLTNDRFRVYLEGIQQGVDLIGLGTWVGALINNNTVYGAIRIAAAVQLWKGSLAHPALWKVELSPTEVGDLSL